jgi:hypothetical protein
MENQEPFETWTEYWVKVSPRLQDHLHSNAKEGILRYLVNCIAIYSWITEYWTSNITKNKELSPKLSIFLVETQDLQRGVLASYEHMTLAPLALILRTILEIHVNLKYITRSSDPARLADLFDRFQFVEEYVGRKASKNTPKPTESELNRLAQKCPEWFEAGKTKLNKDILHWTAMRTNLREMAESSHVGLGDEYVEIYKINSKFTHASPLLRNIYRKAIGLQSIPSQNQSEMYTLLAMGQCMKVLQEACDFFGITFPDYDYAVVCQDIMEAMGQKRLDPKDF